MNYNFTTNFSLKQNMKVILLSLDLRWGPRYSVRPYFDEQAICWGYKIFEKSAPSMSRL